MLRRIAITKKSQRQARTCKYQVEGFAFNGLTYARSYDPCMRILLLLFNGSVCRGNRWQQDVQAMNGHSVDPASAPKPQVNEQDVLLVCGLLVLGIGSKSHATYAPCSQ